MSRSPDHTATLIAYVRLYAEHNKARKGTLWEEIAHWEDAKIAGAIGRSRNHMGAVRKAHKAAKDARVIKTRVKQRREATPAKAKRRRPVGLPA